jgi:hypothetical protein
MKPTPFKHQTNELQAHPDGHGGYNVSALPVWTDGHQVVSCWKMSIRERISALIFGRVWLAVLSGKTSPPVYAQASRYYLE